MRVSVLEEQTRPPTKGERSKGVSWRARDSHAANINAVLIPGYLSPTGTRLFFSSVRFPAYSRCRGWSNYRRRRRRRRAISMGACGGRGGCVRALSNNK